MFEFEALIAHSVVAADSVRSQCLGGWHGERKDESDGSYG